MANPVPLAPQAQLRKALLHIKRVAEQVWMPEWGQEELASAIGEVEAVVALPGDRGAWHPIETAPKGGGAERIDDPKWVEPAEILVWCPNAHPNYGRMAVVSWDWYYAEGGNGYTSGRSAWVSMVSGDPIAGEYGEPTHWMPLPAPPVGTDPK